MTEGNNQESALGVKSNESEAIRRQPRVSTDLIHRLPQSAKPLASVGATDDPAKSSTQDLPHVLPQEHSLELLWIDFTVGMRHAELPEGFARHGNVTYLRPNADDAFPDPSKFDCVIVDFDYPDSRGLNLAQELKQQMPSKPFLMLTLQHSEALAVWSFRAKFWNYLVKPSSHEEIAHCFADLRRILQLSKSQSQRRIRSPRQVVPADANSPAPRGDKAALRPAINYIEQNFRAKVLVADVAKSCGMSPFRFSRQFKQQYGQTFSNYLADFRLDEACRLLRSPNAVVTDVGYAVGFNDASYFTKVFRSRFGVVPSAVIGIAGEVLHNSEPDAIARFDTAE